MLVIKFVWIEVVDKAEHTVCYRGLALNDLDYFSDLDLIQRSRSVPVHCHPCLINISCNTFKNLSFPNLL